MPLGRAVSTYHVVTPQVHAHTQSNVLADAAAMRARLHPVPTQRHPHTPTDPHLPPTQPYALADPNVIHLHLLTPSGSSNGLQDWVDLLLDHANDSRLSDPVGMSIG